jgi:hypothetical protein
VRTRLGHDAHGQSSGTRLRQTVDRLVLKRNGSVAWIVSTNSLGTHQRGVGVRRADARGRALLDAGTAIGIQSLRLTGSTLHWRHGGQTRTASLH